MRIYSASAGIQVATQSASTVFYSFTDHNRQPINLNYDVLEKAERMSNGTMRKYVVAKKRILEVSWTDLPSATYAGTSASTTTTGLSMTVDSNPGAAWIKSFYNDNLFKPVRVRFINSQDDWTKNTASAFLPSPRPTAYEEFWAFMQDFRYDVKKRYVLTDIVDVSLTFVEV